MTQHAVMTGLTLYWTGPGTLGQAANRGGTSADTIAAALRARGVDVAETPPRVGDGSHRGASDGGLVESCPDDRTVFRMTEPYSGRSTGGGFGRRETGSEPTTES